MNDNMDPKMKQLALTEVKTMGSIKPHEHVL